MTLTSARLRILSNALMMCALRQILHWKGIAERRHFRGDRASGL